MLDAVLVSRLVEILNTSSPNLKRKAASILEFVSIMDASMEVINSLEIESGLTAVFQLGASIGMYIILLIAPIVFENYMSVCMHKGAEIGVLIR